MTRYTTRFAKPTATPKSEPTKKQRSQFPTTLAVMAIAGIGLGSWFLFSGHSDSGQGSLTKEQPHVPEPSQEVYVAYQVNTPQAAQLAIYLNHELSRGLNPEHRLNVDVLQSQKIVNIYSNSAEQGEIQQLNKYFQPVPSDDTALVQAVQRVENLAEKTKGQRRLDAFIVSAGTDNPATIKTIQSITKRMTSQNLGNFHLYLVGLAPANKLATSAAFHSIQSSVAGSCTDNYSQCRPFVEELAR